MNTIRPSLDRLLDPSNISVTLKTMDRVATVLGKRLRIELVDAREPEPTPVNQHSINSKN
jgi:hypothetical protein